MAYKDKDRQREANRERQRRYKSRQKALLSMGVIQGVTEDGAVLPPNPEDYEQVFTKATSERTAKGNIRVSKPGDADYVPQRETTRAFVKPKDIVDVLHNRILANPKVRLVPKRGLDIKTFADLPPDVQATINRLSHTNEEKQKRTQIAIKYQQLFPNRYHSTGTDL